MQAEATRQLLHRMYAPVPDDQGWLAGVVEAAETHCGAKKGSAAVIFEGRAPAVDVISTAWSGLRARNMAHSIERAFKSLAPTLLRVAGGSPASQDNAEADRSFLEWLERFESRDMLPIVGLLPNGRGAAVLVNLPSRATHSPSMRKALADLGPQLAFALRLRQPSDEREADMPALGCPPKREAGAMESEARARLRKAIFGFDATRCAAEAELPSARIDARWSLLTRVERDGEEFVVAKRSRAIAAALTPREREIVRHLALGHPPKVVAYELGVASSTVRVLAARAARKLGRHVLGSAQ